MSRANITEALDMHLAAMPGLPPVAWENINFAPETGVGFLSVFTLFTVPEDVGYRDSSTVQRGYLQVNIHWPTNTGAGAAQAQAEAISNWFTRGTSLVNDGTTVIIDRTPEITGGSIEDGRYVIRVRVRFYAQIEPAAVA